MSATEHATAILAECLRNREDDAPRLIWADAIGGERGELVHLQCGRDALVGAELAMRNRRARELLAANAMAWSGLDGLARRVRYRRGFVDAIELDADSFLGYGDAIVERARFLRSLTITNCHPTDTTSTGRSEARKRLAQVVAQPVFKQIHALDLADWIGELDYAWGDVAARVLADAGALRQLRALAMPHRCTAEAYVILGRAFPARLARLRLRDPIHPDTLATCARWMPRLTSLDLPVRWLDFERVEVSVPRLTSLVMRAATAEDVAALATSALAPRIERLTVVPRDHNTRLDAMTVALLARCVRLRALDLRGELVEDDDALDALDGLDAPALRELRLGWSRSRPRLEAVVAHFGAQLESLDLRTSARIDPPILPACDVLIDEPREPELFHAAGPERAGWDDLAADQPEGAPIDPAWLLVEVGPGVGQIFELGRYGDRRVRIGRGVNGDIRFGDGSVGRTHVVLMQRDGQRIIKDMRHSTGTIIDGEHIDHRILTDGMRITMGHIVVRYFAGAGGGARASACARSLAGVDSVT